nr:reverse transcriptase domain-containing protein [Tanacetum cinerariifolium]
MFRGLCFMFRIASNYKDSHAYGFVYRLLELLSLACLYMGIQYPRRSNQIIEPELQAIVETLGANMAVTRTMSELLQAPTEGYEDAIVIHAILAEDFELKFGLLQLVSLSQFHGSERDDPHARIRWFNKITSMLKYKNIPNDAIKLMLGHPRLGLKKNPLVLSIHGKISFLSL